MVSNSKVRHVFILTLFIINYRALAVPDQEEEELQRTKQYEEIAQHVKFKKLIL